MQYLKTVIIIVGTLFFLPSLAIADDEPKFTLSGVIQSLGGEEKMRQETAKITSFKKTGEKSFRIGYEINHHSLTTAVSFNIANAWIAKTNGDDIVYLVGAGGNGTAVIPTSINPDKSEVLANVYVTDLKT